MVPLKKGDQGPEVRKLQRLLRERDFLVYVDGDFGQKTYEAMRAFQSQHLDAHGRPLVVDGKVGPLTWWALENPRPTIELFSVVDYSRMPPRSAGGSILGRRPSRWR
jgi:peptidoglycan hydrolase-like protein with peptidoglycan-binding domain